MWRERKWDVKAGSMREGRKGEEEKKMILVKRERRRA